jgi:uncharacterized membrane protein YkoI
MQLKQFFFIATALASGVIGAKEATIQRTAAEKIALAQVPAGRIKEGELEREHGRLVWSFDIARPNSNTIVEVQVDARNGKVVSVANESPADQAKEAAKDRAEAAKQR